MVNMSDASVIGWSNDGMSFIIRDEAQLSSRVLPQFFKSDKYESFERQLRKYGFKKEERNQSPWWNANPEEHDIDQFQHEHFIRDRPDLLVNISRLQQKKAAEQGSNHRTSSKKLSSGGVSTDHPPGAFDEEAKDAPDGGRFNHANAASLKPPLFIRSE